MDKTASKWLWLFFVIILVFLFLAIAIFFYVKHSNNDHFIKANKYEPVDPKLLDKEHKFITPKFWIGEWTWWNK